MPWMDLEIITLSEVSQIRISYDNITYMWNQKKNDANEFVYKTEIQTHKENKLMLANKESGGER